MNEVMKGIPGNEYTVIGGDMNEYVVNERKGYERMHGEYGFRDNNEAEERF